MVRVHQNSDLVECAICGINGKVIVENGKVRYEWPTAEQARSRMTYAGKLEHRNEIANGAVTQKKVAGLKDLKIKYMHVGE